MITALALALVAQTGGVDRDAVLAAAKAYAEHRWTMTESSTTADCVPDNYASDYAPGEHVGVPYAWGGAMTLEAFDERLAAGQAAGSHSRHGILSCVAGVDCSGFVSQVWKTPRRYSTSSFSQVTREIAIDDLKPGDAFNKPGRHIVVFVGLNEGGEPLFYEAAGGASRVRLHSGWSYLNGYTPIRYDEIREPAAPPAEPADEPPDEPAAPPTRAVSEAAAPAPSPAPDEAPESSDSLLWIVGVAALTGVIGFFVGRGSRS